MNINNYKPMKKLAFLTACAMVGLLCSCEKYIIPAPEWATDVSFSADVQPIFTSNCVSCHGGSRDPNLKEGQSYNALIDGGYVIPGEVEASKIYSILEGSHNSRATVEQRNYIYGWINEGAENN